MRALIPPLLTVLLAIPVFCALLVRFALSGRRLRAVPEGCPNSLPLEGGDSAGARPHTSLIHNGGTP